VKIATPKTIADGA